MANSLRKIAATLALAVALTGVGVGAAEASNFKKAPAPTSNFSSNF